MEKFVYTIKGMTCAACSARVEKAVGGVDGVSRCVVNLATERMTVELDAEVIGKEELESEITKTGYGWEEVKRESAGDETSDGDLLTKIKK